MKAVVLSGATGGLGKALVSVLAGRENFDLIGLYRNKGKFEELSRVIAPPIEGYWIEENEDFSLLGKRIISKEYESIILILNAFSIMPIKCIGDFSTSDVMGFVYGNITRNILLLNRVVGICKRFSRKLRVINLDSGAADYPLTGWSNYCAGKAYINAFLAVAAAENPEFQFVSFDPGVMDTGMQEIIRSVNKEVFSQVETFIGYKNNNVLRNPLDVAKQIDERYISQWLAQHLREKIR